MIGAVESLNSDERSICSAVSMMVSTSGSSLSYCSNTSAADLSDLIAERSSIASSRSCRYCELSSSPL